MTRPGYLFAATLLTVLLISSSAGAQSFESVGQRALGMGGAFVAVADDGSATWWNPAGLATGPFLDLAIARSVVVPADEIPAWRGGLWSVSLAAPPLGVSYYRFEVTELASQPPIGTVVADREDRAAGLAIRSLSVTQFGATVLHTITTGVSAGATLKYVRGEFRTGDAVTTQVPITVSELLDQEGSLQNGDSDGTMDIDVGVLAARGGIRIGATARNLRRPQFGTFRLPRQVRAGAAFDGAAARVVPLTLSVDVDLAKYIALPGERRVIAVGAEQWVRPRRVAIRGGARFNTVGRRERVVTAGASAAVRSGLYVEGHAAFGSDHGENGWGLAARVSF